MNFAAEEFPVWHWFASFLWMWDIISQDCNRSETQMFTQWSKIGFCWYTGITNPAPRSPSINSRSAQDRRSRPPPLFLHFLSWSPLSDSWSTEFLSLWPHHVSWSDLCFATGHRWRGPGHTPHDCSWRTFICLLFKSLHLKQFVPGISISDTDLRQSQQTPSGWPMTIMSITITIGDHTPWPPGIDMSPCHWCLRARVSAY